MDVIPFNVPGLPEPDMLTGEFVVRPISINMSNPQAGPMLSLHSTAATAGAASAPSDGVLCIYPGTDMVSYLFNILVRSGQKDLLPSLLIYSASVEGSCMLLSMSYDLNNNPVLTTTILPEEYLPKILASYEGTTIADVSDIDDRLEFTQVFTSNSFGVIKRISNDLTHAPKEGGNAIFDLQKDLDTLSDVASFYMTRALTLSGGVTSAPTGDVATTDGDPVWELLWRAAPWTAIAGFAIVFVLTRTSLTFRGLNGNLRVDYNLDANRRRRNNNQDASRE